MVVVGAESPHGRDLGQQLSQIAPMQLGYRDGEWMGSGMGIGLRRDGGGDVVT